MTLQNGKCPNCGANVSVDVFKDAAICEYCGSAFVVEKAIHNYNIKNAQFNNATINIERSKLKDEIDAEERMKIRELNAALIKDDKYLENVRRIQTSDTRFAFLITGGLLIAFVILYYFCF